MTTLTNAAWTDLGAGPLQVQALSSTVLIAIAATTPSLGGAGSFPIRRGESQSFYTASHVWAMSVGPVGEVASSAVVAVGLLPSAPSTIQAANRWMFTGQGWRTGGTLYTPGASSLCAIYSQVYISDEYWTTGQRFLFANWGLNSSTSNGEFDNTSAVTYDGATLIYTDIFGAVRSITLTWGGVSSVTLTANGGATPHAWTDPISAWIPPNSRVTLVSHRTTPSSADKVVGSQYRAYKQTMGERVQVSATSLMSLIATPLSISTTVPSGNDIFPCGAMAAVAQGWDGRPVLMVLGTSIPYGQGEPKFWTGRFGDVGYIEKGLASKSGGAQRLPNLHWCMSGATFQGINGTGANQGLSRRIAAIAALGQNYLPFTRTICELGPNDQTSPGTWMTRGVATWNAVKSAWPVPIIQFKMPPRTTSTDAFQTTTNQAPAVNAGAFGYPAGNNWLFNALLDTRSASAVPLASLDQVMDFSDQWDNYPNGGTRGTWRVDVKSPWTGVLQASVSVAATDIRTLSWPPIDYALALTTDNPECVLPYAFFGSSPFFASLSPTTASTHATSGTVKLSNIVDGIHPAAALAQTVADQGIAPAKLAGLFG